MQRVIKRGQIIYPFLIPQPPTACEILNEAGQIVTSGILEKGFCKETLTLTKSLPAGIYFVKPITKRLVYKYDIFLLKYTVEQQEIPVQAIKVDNPLSKVLNLPCLQSK